MTVIELRAETKRLVVYPKMSVANTRAWVERKARKQPKPISSLEFKKKVKELHPAINAGDKTRLAEFQQLMEQKRLEDLLNKKCLCGCGKKLNWHQAVKHKCQFASICCRNRYRYYRKMLSSH